MSDDLRALLAEARPAIAAGCLNTIASGDKKLNAYMTGLLERVDVALKEKDDDGWVGIEDGLPDENGPYVLIATTREGIESEESTISYVTVDVANPVFVRHNAKNGWFTHWKPLPPLPKGD